MKLPDKLKEVVVHFWASRWVLPLALFFGAALFVLLHGNPFELQEMRWLDQVLRWRTKLGLAPNTDPHIVHLDLDSDDLDKSTDLVTEYQNIADLITEVSDLGASVIVFDVVFGRGSRESAQPILEAIEHARSNNCSVVLAEFLDGSLQVKRSFPFTERVRPSGLANVKSDADGVLRHYDFVHKAPDGLEPSLALAGYLAWRRLDWDRVNRSPETGIVSWPELSADYSVPKQRQASAASVVLNFRTQWDDSGAKSFRHYMRAELRSLQSTRQGSQDPSVSPLVNRIVIVSWVAPGIGDMGTTPMGSNQPKALLHSTALSDLIQEDSLARVPPLTEAAAFGLLLPLALAMRPCGRTASLFLWWVFGMAAVLVLGCALLLTTGYIIGSVATGSLWTAMVIGELATRALARPSQPQARPQEIEEKPEPEAQKLSETIYDVFLAHNTQDKRAVLAVATALKQRGLSPWIDVEQVPPGQWFQDVIGLAILRVKSTAIFLGPGGLGRWQTLELRAFVSQCVERQIPIIPVLLPGVDEIPQTLVFLRELNWVSFHGSTDEPEALDRLVWGITGQKRAKVP
ncbi:MAG TPA: CHASE2 domain-containing protein [Terrimicrobiaceae bacterium]